MLVNERRRIIRRSFSIVLVTLGLLLGSIAPVAVLAEQSPDDGGPTRARLIELAAQYPGIEFNDDYTGPLPATLVEAHRQLAALATVRDSVEAMPASIVATHFAPGEEHFGSDGRKSCEAYLSTASVFRLLDIFHVRHTVKTSREDIRPYNITSVSDHSTEPIVRDLNMNGVTIQAAYSELNRWTIGPMMRKLSPISAPRAWWGLFSQLQSPFQCWPVHPFGQKGDKGVRDRIVSARPRAFVRHGLITPIRPCWANRFTHDYCPQINTTGTANAYHFFPFKNYTKELRGFRCFPQG